MSIRYKVDFDPGSRRVEKLQPSLLLRLHHAASVVNMIQSAVQYVHNPKKICLQSSYKSVFVVYLHFFKLDPLSNLRKK
jgi:hypothetical protein